ncbi:hypothetical protein QBC40DRAFT_270468 [Triangularia verruculosa]|uniref:Uncharacterized protein n=1 Tax=Triangularia verruculosa TaxID=2587418 RepID=A0AAN7AZR9_9PEZI|nr:hypothetical protein QBC40DRAFT_270468 [Triangularia verruculosa]
MNFCRLVKLWEGEFQRLRFYECQAEHHRLLTDRELLRVRRAIYIWHWFARVHHSGRQARNIIGTVYFLRRFSTTELHELWDLYGTVSAAVNREICPSVEMVMEVVGDKAQAENIGWGYGAENALILKTIMRLGPGDLMRLLRERWRLGGKASLVRWVRTKEPWIEDSIEVMGMAILGVKFERENMMGLEKGVFPVEGFPGRFGGVLDHEMVEGEELRVLHGGDGGRESGMYGRIGEGFMIEGVRAGRLVARWSG